MTPRTTAGSLASLPLRLVRDRRAWFVLDESVWVPAVVLATGLRWLYITEPISRVGVAAATIVVAVSHAAARPTSCRVVAVRDGFRQAVGRCAEASRLVRRRTWLSESAGRAGVPIAILALPTADSRVLRERAAQAAAAELTVGPPYPAEAGGRRDLVDTARRQAAAARRRGRHRDATSSAAPLSLRKADQ